MPKIEIKDQNFSVVANPQKDKARVAIIISKRVAKSAVRRNRIRRIIRAVFDNNQRAKESDTGIRVYVKNNTRELKDKDIKNNFDRILKTLLKRI